MKEKPRGSPCNMAEVTLRDLELIYRNSETEEEMNLALEYFGVSKEELYETAAHHGWEICPIALKNFVNDIDPREADSSHIEQSHKASIRRLHAMVELAATRLQGALTTLTIPALLEQLETLTKIREKLIKVEYPMYGLSTLEPPAIVNPIQVFLDTAEELVPPEDKEGD